MSHQTCNGPGCISGWVNSPFGVSNQFRKLRCPACKGTGLKLNLLRVVTASRLPVAGFRQPVVRKSVLL